DLEPDRLAGLGRSGELAFLRTPFRAEGVRGETRPIAVAADRAQRIARHEHAGPRHVSLRDRVAQADVHVVEGSDVAHGRETGLEELLRGAARPQSVLRHGSPQVLEEGINVILSRV